jgi:hypothetical protein
VDITVYLPDQLGAEAKAAGLPLSAMLRAAVQEELERLRTLDQHTSEMQEHELELVTKDGDPYTGTIVATLLGEGRKGEDYVYLTEDHRVIWHDVAKGRHWEYGLDDGDDSESLSEALSGSFSEDDQVRIMAQLGLRARVEL